jgi:glutamyl/glutaminyl-tRNA synthetase
VFDVPADSPWRREDGDVNRKRAQAPVRVAALGATVGPPLWEALEVLGRTDTVARLNAAADRLAGELAGSPSA